MPFQFRYIFLICVLGVTQIISPVQADTGESLLWPEQIEAIGDAEAELRYGAEAFLGGASKAGAAEVLALLDAPRLATGDRLSLAGPCRVRSLQVSEYGATAYDFFPCALRTEGPTGLIFQKDAGSQRRHGLILDSEAGNARLIFVGGSYNSGDPPRSYSRFDAAEGDVLGASIDERADSIGMAYRIGDKRWIIVFAPDKGRSEIYEIVRN